MNLFKLLTSRPTHGYSSILPKRDMWAEVAESVGGEFKVVFTKNHDIEIHRITIPHKDWELEISHSESRPLKFKAAFDSSQDLEMIITWEDVIERFFKRFRKPEVQLGWAAFDRYYLIKTNRSDLVKKVITSDIQKSFLKHNIYSLSYTNDQKSRKSEFISVISRTAGDTETNIELIEVFKHIIDNLASARVIK